LKKRRQLPLVRGPKQEDAFRLEGILLAEPRERPHGGTPEWASDRLMEGKKV
jgi:hypothetical protein